MPIGPDEWESGRTEAAEHIDDTVKDRLLEFLELNAGKAYTADELASVYARAVAGEAIAGEDPDGPHLAAPDPSLFGSLVGRVGGRLLRRTGRIESALEELVEEGRVEIRTVETVEGRRTYYRVDRDGG